MNKYSYVLFRENHGDGKMQFRDYGTTDDIVRTVQQVADQTGCKAYHTTEDDRGKFTVVLLMSQIASLKVYFYES